MADSIEWDAPAPEPTDAGEPARDPAAEGSDELLIAGSRPSRWAPVAERLGDRVRSLPIGVRMWAPALLVVAVAAGYLTRGGHEAQTAAPTSRPAPQTESSFGGSSLIIAKALQRAPLTDFTRPTADAGACALVRPGTSPTRAAVLTVRRALPSYRIRDVGRTLDQSTGLCALDVRAADTDGSSLIMEIVAPVSGVKHPFTAVNVGFTSDGTMSTSVASALTVDGWAVTVAAVGPITDQPSSATMLELAQDPSLIW